MSSSPPSNTYLSHEHRPQHLPRSVRFFSASLISWLIWSSPSSMRSSCSEKQRFAFILARGKWGGFKWLYEHMYISICEYFSMYLQQLPEELEQAMIFHLNKKAFLADNRHKQNQTKCDPSLSFCLWVKNFFRAIVIFIFILKKCWINTRCVEVITIQWL